MQTPILRWIQDIPISWNRYFNGDDRIVSGSSFNTMSIGADQTEVVLINNPDLSWLKNEYQNAFVLSQPIAIPEDDRILVVRGKVRINNVQGTTGLWLHATGIFNNQGGMITDGFAGGASGFGYVGPLSFQLWRGWRFQQAEGWKPNLLCFGKTHIKNGDFLELRVTKKVTMFIVNTWAVKQWKTNIATPDVVIQLWLDNYVIGPFFQIGVGKITKNQKSTFFNVHASYCSAQ